MSRVLSTLGALLNLQPRWTKKFRAAVFPTSIMAESTPTSGAPSNPPSNIQNAMGLTRDTVLEMMKDSSNIAGKNYILVDLRRTDFEVRERQQKQ